MAIRCSNCGRELPREDARFCSYCGTYNTSQPQSQSQSAAPPAAGDRQSVSQVPQDSVPVEESDGSHSSAAKVTPWFGVDEEYSELPSSFSSEQRYAPPRRPSSSSPSQERPASSSVIPPHVRSHSSAPDNKSSSSGAGSHRPHMHKYSVTSSDVVESGDVQRRLAADDPETASPALHKANPTSNDGSARRWPGAVTHVPYDETQQAGLHQGDSGDSGTSAKSENSADAPLAVEDAPTAVWQKDQKAAPETAIEDLPTSTWQVNRPRKETTQDIEDLPTTTMATSSSAQGAPAIDIVRENSAMHPIGDNRGTAAADSPLSPKSQSYRQTSTPPRPLQPQPLPVEQRQHAPGSRVSPSSLPPESFDLSGMGNGQAVGQSPSHAVQPERSRQTSGNAFSGRVYNIGRSRQFKRIGALTVLIVLVLAVVSWITIAKPFSVSSDTFPLQSVSSSQLGLTASVPSGWQASTSGSKWLLSDSSHTDQITIEQADAPSGNDLTASLQQQAKSLDMTNTKVGTSVSFAGSSWSQLHGDFQLQGASYSGTIYAVVHGSRLYIMTTMAPKSTFNDAERLIFAPIRNSMKFR